MSAQRGVPVVSARFSGVVVEVTKGDIADQPGFDAIVNAANSQLAPGAGVAGAVHRAAGPALYAECRPLAPIATGDCVITSGQRLANRHVIHCLGPVFAADADAPGHLASCHRRALELAEGAGLTSLCFPAISTGVFGYPTAQAAETSIATVAGAAASLRSVRRIRFVLFDHVSFSVFAAVLGRIDGEQRANRD